LIWLPRVTEIRKAERKPTKPACPSQTLRAKFLQHTFTHQIGITLAGFGKFDDSFREDFIGKADVRELASILSVQSQEQRSALLGAGLLPE